MNEAGLTMASTGAAEASFEWFLPVPFGGPVMPGVRLPYEYRAEPGMKNINKAVIAGFLSILILSGIALAVWYLRCPDEIYTTIGIFESNDAGLREAVPKLYAELRRCPEAGVYRIVWIERGRNRQALLYERQRRRLGYELDVYSGISGRAYIVDETAIGSVAEKGGTLEDFGEYDQSRR